MEARVKHVLFFGINILLFIRFSVISEMRDVTSRDCVQVRYISGVWMSPQGTRIAYLVKSPNLDQNRNDYQLYVRDLKNEEHQSLGRLLVTGSDITEVRWLGDGARLTMLMSVHGLKTLVAVSVNDLSRITLLSLSKDVEAYSTDGAGTTIAYSIADTEVAKPVTHSEDETADGYRVRFGETKGGGWPTSRLYTIHRQSDGTWASPEQLTIEDPFTHERFTHIRGLSGLSLSPNGKRLALQYWTDSPLTDWANSPYIKANLKLGPLQRILVLQNLENQNTVLGFKSVFPDSLPLWSADSRSFLMNAHSPVGTGWERDDIRDHRAVSGLDANLFLVNVESGKVDEVLRHVPDHHEGPLFWRSDGDVIVHLLGNEIARFHNDRESWREISRIKLPETDGEQFWFLASDGVRTVGVRQALTVPEDLFTYDSPESGIRTLTDLNPQLRGLKFAAARKVSWTTSDGLDVTGLLFMPSDYRPGKRYPMVIQTKGDQGWFTCDSGPNHDPSFAPQPIANSGMMYLVRTNEPGFNFQDELAKEPQGYPGQLGLAAQEMHIWESAVDSLNHAGIIDPAKVGIIGFSATGFYVEFALIHSRLRYAAATATDNEQGSISEYWLTPTFSDAEEFLYGGPPYGDTLKNWREYSISFNLDKVHTPLLMEEMGYGVHDDMLGQIPRNLAVRYEIYKGLTRLGRPVEMYYYPDEGHTPDGPRARLASLQRNVDWYRFWLQGFEDPDPKKSEQYQRWRKLRALHIADVEASSGETDSVRYNAP